MTTVGQPRGELSSGDDARRSVRAELQGVVDRLIEDYRGEIPAGSVIRCVARCTEIATRYGVPKPALATVVERLARSTLDARSRSGPAIPPQLEVWLPRELVLDRIADQHAGTTDEPCTSG